MTTSIPEAPGSGRNWDYRYCWLRDGYFVVNALNRLGATDTMERYLGYIAQHRRRQRRSRAAAGLRHRRRAALGEPLVTSLPGLPRHGAGARRQPRLPAGAARCLRLGDPRRDPRLLRPAPDPARRRGAVPAAGAAGRRAPRCSTSPMPASGSCAAARACTPSPASCAGPPATAWPGSPTASDSPSAQATGDRDAEQDRPIHHRARWSDRRGSFVSTFDGEALDASLLLLAEVDFLAPTTRASPARSRPSSRT